MQQQSRGTRGQGASLQSSSEEILAPYGNLIEQMISKKLPVVVSSSSIDFSFSSYVLSQGPRGVLTLKNTVPLDHIHEVIFSHDLQLVFGDMSFGASSLMGDGVNFLFQVEKVECLGSARKSPRTFMDLEHQGYVECMHPLDKKTSITKKLVNLSKGGVSFETSFDGLLFYPGQEFSQGKIRINSKLVDTQDFRVLHCQKYITLQSATKYLVGACFIPRGNA